VTPLSPVRSINIVDAKWREGAKQGRRQRRRASEKQVVADMRRPPLPTNAPSMVPL